MRSATAGFDASYADAFDDESYDDVIRAAMKKGLDLTGDDVGTPIIALDDDNGDRVALFGPVITRVPPTEQSLKLWDAFVGGRSDTWLLGDSSAPVPKAPSSASAQVDSRLPGGVRHDSLRTERLDFWRP